MKTARIRLLVAAGAVAMLASRASAYLIPSFSLEGSAWSATDIVVVSQDAKGTSLTVVETWKGDLKAGTAINVSGLPMGPVPIAGGFEAQSTGSSVSGLRILLFLKRGDKPADPAMPDGPREYVGASSTGSLQIAAVWIDGTGAYAFQQQRNPGPCDLQPLFADEAELKKQALAVVASRDDLKKAQTIADIPARVTALVPMARGPYWEQRKEALAALGASGKDAVLALRSMLRDTRYDQSTAVVMLGTAAGGDAPKEMTDILHDEILFWKKRAPTLPVGWANSGDVKDREELIGRTQIIFASLYVLDDYRYEPAGGVVSEIKILWNSSANLYDKQLVDRCDQVLKRMFEYRPGS